MTLGSVNIFDDLRQSIENGAEKEIILQNLKDTEELYKKTLHRLEIITIQSDRQQEQVLKLNEKLEKTIGELNDYKDSLEIKVADETEKRLTQEKILIQNAKMAEMGNMLGAIIHQWNQPITVIGMIADLLEAEAEDGVAKKEDIIGYTDTIRDRIKFLSATIQDFRNFFKPDKEVKLFSPKELVENVVSIISHQILKYKATLTVSGDSGKIAAGFPNEIKHVILNLINNALEACGQNKTEKPVINIDITRQNDKAVITISDNGGGIPEEIMQKLFEPYNSSKGEAGTGIGLTLAKTIVEEHHKGSITAKNTDIGALFRIELPTVNV